ncbi:hypothetical protein [Streptomyces sp. JH34]|uniref:hypothetical protein n=1 Tax=Streptomyces sp. JH34 TaxID=2793633 RepID=UPI0023F70707|nr:hypothetical protein [Streptomyces sp. JH34]MDF6020384.1 hypothetical protein [Streptomyces sp. JH34]
MRVTRGVRKVAAVAAVAVVVVLGPGLSAVAEPAPRGFAPEADVAHHGRVSLREERIEVRLRTGNRGPSPLADATVRLRFSAPLAVGQLLPQGCLRSGSRTVLCGTGPLGVSGEARRTALGLRLTGRPAEVAVRVDTVWNGGASDRNRRNDTHEVLVLSTGDAYVF